MKMNKIISFLLTLAIIIGTFPATLVSAEWDGTAAASLSGTGTTNDPYIISNAAELKKAQELINANANGEANAVFSVTADIDYEGNEWTPIAKDGAFTGKFFGGYHVIKNLKITTYSTTGNHGFFARTGGYIHGLGLENVTVEIAVSNSSTQAARIGAFVGLAAGTITECYVANSTVREMKPTMYGLGVGVFGGLCQYSNISNCYVYNSTIAASSNVGCFIGRPENNGNTITNCYAADITVDNTGVTNGKETANIGRFIFEHKPANATVSNCHSNFEGSTINDFVKIYSDKDVIVEELVTNLTDTKFAVNSAVNGGYPYLASFPVSVPEVTEAPTEAPTATPTPVVTEAPTATPTPVVTEAPTAAPTATPVVTPVPTVSPAATATPAPTATPIIPATALEGEGTEASPYLISNASELKLAAQLINANANGEQTKVFSLTADIDYQNNEWTPLAVGGSFTGIFDGNGHVIKNFKITENHTLIGFFSDMETGAVVSDLGLENANVYITSNGGKNLYLMGIFAGRAAGQITNCYVKDSVIEQHSGSTEWAMAAFAGRLRRSADVYNNCYVYNVKMFSSKTAPYAFFGTVENSSTKPTLNNCYVAGVTTRNEKYYGFGPNVTVAAATANCYTTLADTGVTGFANAAYADKATIVNKLVTTATDAGYAVSEEINDGYPCFGWEIWDGEASTTLEGAGTKASPYLIKNAADLKLVSNLTNANLNGEASAHYKLAADIDYCNQEWLPIGRNAMFKGTFDGAGHVIRNVKITDFGPQYALVGFFGDADEGSRIENLGIENLKMNLYTNKQVAYIGGFIGRTGGTVKNCYIRNSSVVNTGNINEWATGAFAGGAWRSAIFINCYVYNVSVRAKAVPGAFIGKLDENTTFNNCYTAGVTFTNSAFAGFGKLSSKRAAVNNSYTTVADTGVTDGFGMAVSDKAAIVAGLTNGAKSVYAADAGINDGYPYIVYTEPPAIPTPPAHDGNINIVLMGDSLTDNTSNNIEGNADDKTGWEGKIGNYLDSSKVTLIKHGHNSHTMKRFIDGYTMYGNHTCSWETIKNEFGAHDYVVIALGTNDHSRIAGTATDAFYTKGQFKEWYKDIINDVRYKNAHILILTPPPIASHTTGGKYTGAEMEKWFSTQALLELEDEVENLTVINVGNAYASSVNTLIDSGDYTAEDMQIKKDGDITTESGLIYVDWGHFSEYGADLLAWTISKEIAKKTSGLEDYVVTKSMPMPSTVAEPTATPVVTPAPTVVPTATPTATPAPTVVPTATPVVTPVPTTAPTATPVPGEIVPAASLLGSGTETVPYIISNASELMKANEMINSSVTYAKAHYKVTADIDYQNYEWVPLGRPHSDGFAGTFDGGNHIIKNVKVTNFGDQNAINGFFASANDTTVIKNLGIENFNLNIYTNKQTAYIGGFIGRAAGTISNCYIKNSSVVNTGNFTEWGTGAFAGCAWRSAHFINCYAYNVSVSAKTTPGAFIGKLDDVTKFTNCYTAGITFTNATYRGFGSATKSATITNSYTAVQSVGTSDHLNATYTDKDGIVIGLVTNLADSAYGVSADINDGFPHLLSFIPDPNQADVDADAAALVVPASVTGAFQAALTGANGSTITWQSSNTAVLSFVGGDATVICGDTDVTVTVIATITKGRVSATKMFEVTVKQKVVAEVTEGELVISPDSVALDVTYSGLYGKGYREMTFMAVAVNDKGDILARGMDTATISDSTDAVTENFSATLDTTEGTVNYYLWADNNISLLDNTPMDITNLKAKAKTKGIALSWDASFDDSGDAVQYKVYNGNTLLTTTYKTSYMATGSLTEAREFNVVAVDGNGKETPVAVSNAATMMEMYYNNPTSYNAIWKVASNGTPGGDGDSYYVVQEVLIGGVLTKVYVTETSTRDRMIYFARADAIKGSDSIPETERNLTFEVDYLDNSTKPLNFVYNSVIPSGEDDSWKYARKAIPIPRVNDGLWKTAVIHVTDAQLRNSGQTGGAEFGVLAGKGTPTDETQVREIRMCKTSDYE